MNEFQPIVQQIIQLFVVLLALAIPVIGIGAAFARLVVWGKGEFERIKNEQPEVIRHVIDIAVSIGAGFAEKIDLAGMLEEYGRDKKTLALEAAQRWLKEQGYDIDLSVLDAVLEDLLFRNPEEFPSTTRSQRG